MASTKPILLLLINGALICLYKYGQRKVKVELGKLGWTVSRRRIGRIMKEQGLVSKYTVAQFKPSKTSCNESKVGNT